MSELKNYLRQHNEIKDIINSIRGLMERHNYESNLDIIVKNINLLAGKIKMHLISEDKFLYPKMLNSNNEKIRITADKYINEMGALMDIFNDYKNKFNTKNKILENLDSFPKATKNILSAIELRMVKEENGLYNLI